MLSRPTPTLDVPTFSGSVFARMVNLGYTDHLAIHTLRLDATLDYQALRGKHTASQGEFTRTIEILQEGDLEDAESTRFF